MNRNFVFNLILLFVLAFTTFAQEKYVRAELWQKEIAAFAESDKREFPKTGGIVFVGSSTIRGWKTLHEDFPDYNILNRGFGGSHLEDVNHYLPDIVLPYKPKLIVLYAGENDITAGKSVERVFGDFKHFVSAVHQKLPKTRIVFVSLKPSPSRWSLREKLARANDLIKAAIEKDKRLQFVDVWQPMLAENGEPKPEIFMGDKLHLNAEGYKIWRAALSPHLKKGLKGNFR
jgi:lysophospholipase L1-like esterase